MRSTIFARKVLGFLAAPHWRHSAYSLLLTVGCLLVVNEHALAGLIISIENKGLSPFTEITLGFDVPPIDPGQTLDVRVGDPGSPTNLGEFQFLGMPVSRSNPLLPGAVAIAGPFAELIDGTFLEFNQVASFGNGFSGYFPFTEIIPDVTVLPFEFSHPGVIGGKLVGEFRFTSDAAAVPEPSMLTMLTLAMLVQFAWAWLHKYKSKGTFRPLYQAVRPLATAK